MLLLQPSAMSHIPNNEIIVTHYTKKVRKHDMRTHVEGNHSALRKKRVSFESARPFCDINHLLSLPHHNSSKERIIPTRRGKKKRKSMERTKVAGQSQADLEDGDEKLDAILQSDEIDAIIEEALRDATEDL